MVVSLEASITKYERAMQRAVGVANSRTTQIENRFNKMNANLGNQFSSLSGVFLAGFGANAAKQLLDAGTRIQNSLKVAGLEGEALTAVYDELFVSAQRNAAPLEALTDLYGRAALVQKELGVSTAELLNFTDKVAVALRVSGKSASESSGALEQLSQALGSGVVRAEEFNSILEGALPIAQAAAAGLDEAGGSVAKLRQLVVDGKVSSEAFFRAFEAGATILDDKVASSAFTIDQGFTRLQNTLIDTAVEIDKATGISAGIGSALDELAGLVEAVGQAFRDNAAPIGDFINMLATGLGTIEKWRDEFRAMVGLSGKGGLDDFLDGTALLQGRIGFLSDQMAGKDDVGGGASLGDLQAFTGAGSGRKSTVSLKDFATPSSKGGGGGSKKVNPYQREVNSVIDETEALLKQTEVMRALNPLVNDYGYAVTKAKVAEELRTAAIEAGMPVNAALQQSIDFLAEGYAQATVEAAKLKEAQDEARQSMEDWFALGRDAAQGFIQHLREGKSAAEALGNVADKLIDKFIGMGLGMGLDSLFGTGSGASPFGAIGKLFGFASGTANTGGRRGQVRGVVHGQEAVIPLPGSGRVPVEIRAPNVSAGGAAAGGNLGVDIRVSVDDDGKLQVVARQAGAAAAGAYVNSRVPRMINEQAPKAVAAANMRRRN